MLNWQNLSANIIRLSKRREIQVEYPSSEILGIQVFQVFYVFGIWNIYMNINEYKYIGTLEYDPSLNMTFIYVSGTPYTKS